MTAAALPTSAGVASFSGAVGAGAATTQNLAEEKGFEPLVELPPRRFSKPRVTQETAPGYGPMGTLGELAIELLKRLGEGTATSGEVARLAADILSNPPPLIAAAQKYLGAVGSAHEGDRAAELLELAAEASS